MTCAAAGAAVAKGGGGSPPPRGKEGGPTPTTPGSSDAAVIGPGAGGGAGGGGGGGALGNGVNLSRATVQMQVGGRHMRPSYMLHRDWADMSVLDRIGQALLPTPPFSMKFRLPRLNGQSMQAVNKKWQDQRAHNSTKWLAS